ncbi:MAG: SMC family ATPase [Euryarchaeota archaeon]|nr:SMC family ATPase [Euryarchaeota archaeon]
MLLRTISLRNYRRYRSLELDIPEGVVAIVGPNGSGKSTLVEAVAWAFFGNEEETTRGDKKGILRQGSGKGEKCQVVVEFELDSVQYRVERQMSASGTVTASLESAGKSLGEGAVPVTEKLTGILGMDYKAFFVSVFARQKELDALTRQSPSDRKKTVLRMLGISSIDNALIAARKKEMEFSDRLDFMRNTLRDPETGGELMDARQKAISELEKAIEAKRSTVMELDKQLTMSKANLRGLEKAFEASKSSKAEHDMRKEACARAEMELDGARKAMSRLEKELSEIAKTEERLKALSSREAEFSKARKEHESLQKSRDIHMVKNGLCEELELAREDRNEREARLDALSKDLSKAKTVEDERGDIERKLSKSQSSIEAIAEKVASNRQLSKGLEKERRELEKRMADISELGEDSKCPTCDRPIGDHRDKVLRRTRKELDDKRVKLESLAREAESLAEENEALKSQREALSKKKSLLEKGLKALERKVGEADGLTQEISSLDERVDAIEKRVAELGDIKFDAKRFESLGKELKTLEREHDEFVGLKRLADSKPAKARELEGAKEDVADASKSFGEAKCVLASLGFDASAHTKLENEVRMVKDGSHALELQFERSKGEADVLREKARAVETDIERLREAEKEAERLTGELEYASQVSKLLDAFKRHMVARIRPALASATSRLLDSLSAGKYSQVELDEDYGVKVFDGGSAFGLERFSGGEGDMVNLCLRLAISQLIAERGGLSGLNMVVLDEVFGSQDQDRRKGILTALDKLSNIFKQIVLITHIEDVRESVGSVISVEEKGYGESGAKLAL